MPPRDPLTGLLNRESFDAEIIGEVDRALAAARPLGVLFVDVDHFKRVNDQHGHQKGDAVLAEAGRLVEEIAECKGKAYRYGGEEMVVLLPNHTQNEAIAVAERLRGRFERQSLAGVVVTVSIGVASLPEHGVTSAALIKAADTAVYDAKDLGRNLVRFAGEPPPEKTPRSEPHRKRPEGGRLTERQRDWLKSRHFQGYAISCLEDNAILEVIELRDINSATTELAVRCPMCGLNEKL